MATNFLLAAGTNGFIASPINLLSSELNSLANGAAATSSVGGSSGVFSQSSFSQALWDSLYFVAGGAFTPNAGGIIPLWFLLSPDGGTTFESLVATPSATVPALSRTPDAVIVFDNAAFAANNIRWCSGRRIDAAWESFKVVAQNLNGVTLPSSGNLIKAGGVTDQY